MGLRGRGEARPERSAPSRAEESGGRAAALQSAIQLLPYQRRWVEDDSKLKIAVKARQIGYSFAATLRAVLKCLERRTTWVFLSKGERQSRLLMEKVQDHIRACGIVARTEESTFFEGASIKQLEVRFPNGSVIYGLPANPDTARGYSGHVTLDEFAFHADADKIYAALFPTITRGYGLEVISTPNGTQGKFHELAKAAGLAEGVGAAPRGRPGQAQGPAPTWSIHWCDVYDAVRDGLRIDLALLRAGCEDETAWQQEFCCQFVSTAENFFPPDLLTDCISAEATTDFQPLRQTQPLTELGPASASRASSVLGTGDWGLGIDLSTQHLAPSSQFFLGIDIGRRHDRTVFWMDEAIPSPPAPPPKGEGRRETEPNPLPQGEGGPEGQVRASITRLVRTMTNTPFAAQLAYARELLRREDGNGQPLIRRAAIDATGIGAPLAESLAREFGPRIEPVVFTAAVKEDLAFRTKRRMEARLTLLPDTREIRRAFSAVKKFITPSGNLRFDAARTEAGHADEFWAKALADLAADPAAHAAARAEDAFLADAAPLVSPMAFGEVAMDWGALGWN